MKHEHLEIGELYQLGSWGDEEGYIPIWAGEIQDETKWICDGDIFLFLDKDGDKLWFEEWEVKDLKKIVR